MRKRIFMLLALALMVVAAMALSGVAQAASPRAQCKQEAASLGLDLTGYKFVYGNNKNNVFTDTAGQPEVFCGLGGNDTIRTLAEGDIFIGGAGTDYVYDNYGTFNGSAGDDFVDTNYDTFNGGIGLDTVNTNYGTLSSVEVVEL
jgi:hypothetical protein